MARASDRPSLWLFGVVCATAAATEAAAVVLHAPHPILAPATRPFPALVFASVLLAYFMRSPARAHRAVVSRLTAVPAAIMAAAFWWPTHVVRVMCFALGAAGCLGVVGFAMDARRAGGWRAAARGIAPMLILPVAAAQVPFWLWRASHFNPVIDPAAFAVDAALGVPVTYLIERSYALLPAASAIATASYYLLAAGLMAVSVAPSQPRPFRVVAAIVAAGAAGFACYLFCPVVGPAMWMGPNLTSALPSLAPAAVVPRAIPEIAIRNGMPSLHTAWALLIIFNTRGLPRALGRVLIAGSLLAIWAAIGLHEHWFVDVVVAVPFAAAVQCLVVGRGARSLLAGVVFAAVAVGWMSLLRNPWTLAQFSAREIWAACALSVVVPVAAAIVSGISTRRGR